MILGDRLEIPAENVPTPKVPLSVVVAMVVARVDEMPYANPRTVEDALPSLIMLPFNVADKDVTDEAADVVTAGLVVVMKVISGPYPIPAELVEYARK